MPEEVQAKALNDRGDIVGFADNSDPKDKAIHAILWKNGKACRRGWRASKTMTPSSVTRKADCHPLSEMTYMPPPKLFTAYPMAGSIFQNFAFTESKTGT